MMDRFVESRIAAFQKASFYSQYSTSVAILAGSILVSFIRA